MTTPTRRELGLLILVILKAQHLPDPHKFSKQDPFVIAEVGGEQFRTQTDRGGGQVPLWDEEFRLKLFEEEGKPQGEKLTLKVMRKEGVRAKDEELIGEGSVLVDGKSWREFDEWIELKSPDGKWVGEVYVEMTFYPLEAQNPLKTNLKRHPTKLDASTRSPLPPSLLPGGGGRLTHAMSNLTVNDQIPVKDLPPVPATRPGFTGRLPYPGDPDHSHFLPDSLRPATNSYRPTSASPAPALHEPLPLPGEQHHLHPSEYQQQIQQFSTQTSPQSTLSPHHTPPFSTAHPDPSFSLSSSPSNYAYPSPLHSARPQPASYPFLTSGTPAPPPLHSAAATPQPHSTSYPPAHASTSALPSPVQHQYLASSPVIPARPSSAASSNTERMPGSWEYTSRPTPTPSPGRPAGLPAPPVPERVAPSPSSNVPPPPRRYTPSPSPSTSEFPSSSTPRPPLPPNPAGVSTPSFSPSFEKKAREAANGRDGDASYETGERHVPPPPAYPGASVPARSVPPRPQDAEASDQQRSQERNREREAQAAAEREAAERAKRERERVAEENKLARIRQAQEARAKKLAQEREDERLAIEAEEREREAERERRETERRADEEFVRKLQDEERERVERERRDEELARELRAEEEAERVKRERDDEEFVKRLRAEDQRLEEEERQRRLVEDERLARSLAERENEANELRRQSSSEPPPRT